MKNWLSNPDNRKWLYNVAITAFAVLLAYGLIQADKIPVWIELIGNLLGVSGLSLARAHVYPKIVIGPAAPPSEDQAA